jgi:hypothetical protein
VAEGPGRTIVRSEVLDTHGESKSAPVLDTQLPGLLMPGANVTAAVRVAVPKVPGHYQVRLSVTAMRRLDTSARDDARSSHDFEVVSNGHIELVVADKEGLAGGGISSTLLEAVQRAIAEADRHRRLPDDYLDVTEGLLARWKRKIKQKLLGNFKHAYVDVLSRQQSRFNEHMLAAVRELSECMTVVDHLAQMQTEPDDVQFERLREAIFSSLESGKTDEIVRAFRVLLDQLAESRNRGRDLEQRVNVLEQRVLNSVTSGTSSTEGMC